MGRSPCCSKVGLRRGPWSAKEDALLINYIRQHGEGQWRSLPWKAGLLRCGKSSRLRWMNYLRPGIKRGNISEDEEDLIVRMHGLLGNRWSLIAGRLPGRTDNEIKNYWNTHLLKKLTSAGIHPKPHKDLPKPDGKKKEKWKKIGKAENDNNGSDGGKLTSNHPANPQTTDNPPKTKVYLPKPMRVSSVFPRTTSYDSLGNGTRSSDTAEKVPVAEEESRRPVAWPPLFDELENATYGMYGGGVGEEEEDFLGGGYTLPLLHHSDSISSDVNMLDKVYDEYLQLL